jgi:uncharacterized membrane protein YphA (DoxX/SURF4 family)
MQWPVFTAKKNMTEKNKNILAWGLRLVAAVIMLQTLFFKFTGAEESVFIFSTLGLEPWGRIGTGVMELIAAILILIPKTTALGALLALGIMGGAILSHIFFLGISVQDDNGQLFSYALLVFLSALTLLYMHRQNIPIWNRLSRV